MNKVTVRCSHSLSFCTSQKTSCDLTSFSITTVNEQERIGLHRFNFCLNYSWIQFKRSEGECSTESPFYPCCLIHEHQENFTSFELMVVNVGNNDSICVFSFWGYRLLSRTESRFLPACWGRFLQTLLHSHKGSPSPPLLHQLRPGLLFGSLIPSAAYASVTKTSPQLVCTPQGPLSISIGCPRVPCITHQAENRASRRAGQLASCPLQHGKPSSVSTPGSDKLRIYSQFTPY